MQSRLLFFVALALAAVLGACADRSGPRFPHQLHLAGLACGAPDKPACLSCNSCHAVSKDDRSHKLPPKAVCARCHTRDAKEAMAVLETVPERATGPIRFDHDQHLALKKIQGQCVPCHAGVVEPGVAKIPAMKKCFTCHEHEAQWKKGVCAPCHARQALTKTMPKTFLRHDEGFVRHHSTQATQQKQLCQSCHSESQCDSCHDVSQNLTIEKRQPERIERKFVHRGDFVARHAIEAQSQASKCARCHTPESCDACHVARGVSGNRVGSRNPHPPGWVGGNPDSRSFHGKAAKRDIVLCAGCHEQGPATNCIRCHKVGAFGGNPHPGGWKSTLGKGSQMCRYCHE